MTRINRRHLLMSAATGVAALGLTQPRISFASGATDSRFVVIVLRGGMDGLAALPAYGDPHYHAARAGLALPRPGESGGTLRLDDTFALHPTLGEFARLYHDGSLIAVHAACVPYHGRSHFEAQNVLENGSAIPYLLQSGWLNRALAALPASTHDLGIAIAQTMPVILRGAAAVTSWYPSILPPPATDTLDRIASMYAADAKLGGALEHARAAHQMAAAVEGGAQFPALMKAAGGFLARPGGPRIAMIETSGWDTHANQSFAYGALSRNLTELDRGVAALRSSLGDAWNHTAVLVMTEFGRTVAMNGTDGTDHGTGGAAFLLGGAVAGGRTVSDWPGLAPSELLEGRDLRPTTDLRSVMKGVLAEHLSIAETYIDDVVFPDSGSAKTMRGLIRTA